MKNIKAVIFDIDDVIIHNRDKDGKYFWLTDIEKDLGINQELVQTELFTNMFEAWDNVLRGKKAIEDMISIFLSRYDFSITSEEFLNYLLEKDTKVDDRVLDIVRKLKSKGYKTFLATHQERKRGNYIWHNLGFKEYFDEIFIPEYVDGFIKTECEFFDKVCEKIGISGEEIIFIDDKEDNIKCAESCGWNVYHYIDYNKAFRELFCKLI